MRVAVLVLVLAGCTVSRPDPGGAVFRCGSDADCLDGYSCVDRTPLGLSGYCVPACDPARPESCPDGVCTADGSCLDGCALATDGTVVEGCSTGLTCVRTDVLRTDGVCYAIDGCSVASDCASEPGEAPRTCLGDALGIPTFIPGVEIASNALYCIDEPQGPLGDRCPEGTVLLQGATPVCLPTCDAPTDRCPPGSSCYADLGWYFGAPRADVCFAGTWGAPCVDDAQCLFGRCLDVGGRHVCTERCDDVPFAPGPDGCAGIAGTTFIGSFGARCEEVEGDRVCVLRGEVGAPCGADMPCIDALQCFLVRGERTGLCTRGCMSDPDCWPSTVPEERRMNAYCEETLSACLPRRRLNQACTRDGQCASLHCRLGLCSAT